jgi:SAM-dependent methyltransferase
MHPSSDSLATSCPNCANATRDFLPTAVWQLGEEGRSFRYAQCTHCELLFANPIPSREEVTSFYAGSFDYGIYSLRKPLKRLQGTRRWTHLMQSLVDANCSSKRLLDVGCGHGWVLNAARRSGWECTGLDFPSEATEFARRELGLDIIEGDFLSAELQGSSYDVISLWHALEHMPDPDAVLKRAQSLLRPDGVLVIGVPNSACRGLLKAGAGWIWLQQPFVHLWHFSERNLPQYLRRAGFTHHQLITRDTWDANYLYDALVFPRINERVILRGARLCARALRKFGVKEPALEKRISFYIDEVFRIAACGAQFIAGIQSQSKRSEGSELVAIAGFAERSPVTGTTDSE